MGLFSLALIAFTVGRFQSETYRPQQLYIAPPPQMERFVFGYHELAADMIWVRAIQDFDFCESKINAQTCRGQSWLFKMLDTVTNLSPKFRIVYATGALALSVLISDIEGASRMFDKGVEHFPNDKSILYRAGYHALLEEKNVVKAADLMRRTAQAGGPSWLYSLAARLYTDGGKREMGEALLKDIESSGVEDSILQRIREKLRAQ